MSGQIKINESAQVDNQPSLSSGYSVPYTDVDISGPVSQTLAPTSAATIPGVAFDITTLQALVFNNNGNADLTFTFNTDASPESISVPALGFYKWDAVNGGSNPITSGTSVVSLVVSTSSTAAGLYAYVVAYN